jgi:hypothetical protein
MKIETINDIVEQPVKVESESIPGKKGQVGVKFFWQASPREFGGFNQEQLPQLVHDIADFFNIPDEIRNRIHLYFGDHLSAQTLNGKILTDMGRTYMVCRKDSQETIEGINIVINRSEELHASLKKKWLDENPDVPDTDFNNNDVGIFFNPTGIAVRLRHPWEDVVWSVAEELNHAGLLLKLDSLLRVEDVIDKYGKYASSYHGGKEVDPNAENILELAAARQLLRFLSKEAIKRDPSRIPVYEEALEKSLTERLSVHPYSELIISSILVKTGYRT